MSETLTSDLGVQEQTASPNLTRKAMRRWIGAGLFVAGAVVTSCSEAGDNSASSCENEPSGVESETMITSANEGLDNDCEQGSGLDNRVSLAILASATIAVAGSVYGIHVINSRTPFIDRS
jgi:hypothetical protein